jgi:DNA-binding LacI/PurR family transcriptional regulator
VRFRVRCLNRYGSQMSGIPSSRRPATLASLAAELGVSRTTVSNAYNRPDQLSAPLRARVLEAARRLGYPGPDPVARSLRTRKAGAVGLLLTEALSYAFRDPVATGFLEGLALACEEAGQGLLLVPVSPEQEDVTAVHQAGVDGFVVYSVREDDPHFLAVLERPLPIVVCDQPHGVEGVDRVGVDDRAGMLALARHLAGLGHRRIGVLCMRLGTGHHDGPADLQRQENALYPVQRDRLAGLRDGFAEVGVEWARVPVIERFYHSIEAGEQGTAELLAAHPEVTAVVCTSDVLALGALQHAAEQRLKVPEDLTITGFDGVPEAERAGLTTVRQPVLEKGRVAGQLLLQRGDRNRPRRVSLPTELIVGTTSAPPREDEKFFSGW